MPKGLCNQATKQVLTLIINKNAYCSRGVNVGGSGYVLQYDKMQHIGRCTAGDTAHAAVPTCMHAHRYIYKLCLCGHGGEFCQIFYTAELQLQLLCLNIYTFESEMNKSLC